MIPDRQRPQHYRVDQAKNGGVCANAQGQRENGHGRKAWKFREHSQAIMDVLPELLQPNETPHFARLFLYSRHIAELSYSRITRFIRRHPALDVVLRLPLDMLANVLI